MLANRVMMGYNPNQFIIYNSGYEDSSFYKLRSINTSESNGVFSKFSTHMYMRLTPLSSDTSSARFAITTTNSVDVTPYKTLYIDWVHTTTSGSGTQARLVLSPTMNPNIFGNEFISTALSFNDRRIFSCDISNINGMQYPHVILLAPVSPVGTTGTIFIHKIWME